MRDFYSGFSKAALEADSAGAAIGAALGMGLARRGGAIGRLTGALIGAETGHALGRGVRGMMENPDYSNLTQGERELLQEDADRMIAGRNKRRLQAIALGLAYGVVSGSPLGFLPAVPAATIGVYGDETLRQGQLAADFRRGRKKETA